MSRDDGFGFVFFNKLIEVFVGDDDVRFFGFDGGIGEIF